MMIKLKIKSLLFFCWSIELELASVFKGWSLVHFVEKKFPLLQRSWDVPPTLESQNEICRKKYRNRDISGQWVRKCHKIFSPIRISASNSIFIPCKGSARVCWKNWMRYCNGLSCVAGFGNSIRLLIWPRFGPKIHIWLLQMDNIDQTYKMERSIWMNRVLSLVSELQRDSRLHPPISALEFDFPPSNGPIFCQKNWTRYWNKDFLDCQF